MNDYIERQRGKRALRRDKVPFTKKPTLRAALAHSSNHTREQSVVSGFGLYWTWVYLSFNSATVVSFSNGRRNGHYMVAYFAWASRVRDLRGSHIQSWQA